MARSAIFCKSFCDDFGRLGQLIASYEKHAYQYPLLLSVPAADRVALDSVRLPPSVTVINDEDYLPEIPQNLAGWLQQQICKLNVHRTDFADAYMCVDSDMYFIGNIEDSDFFEEEALCIVCAHLYSVFSSENSSLIGLLTDSLAPESLLPRTPPGSDMNEAAARLLNYIASPNIHDKNAEQRLSWISDIFRVDPGLAFQPTQIYHKKILQSFENFLTSLELSASAAIQLSPWENNWYGAFAFAAHSTDVCARMPLALHFPSKETVDYAKNLNLDTKRFSRHFRLVAMAARHFDDFNFE